MSEHEIFKLKKELVDCRKQIEQQKVAIKLKEAQIIDFEEEADFQKNEAENYKQFVNKLQEKISEQEKIISEDRPEEKEMLKKELYDKEEQLQREISLGRELKNQIELKEAIIESQKNQLREIAIKYKEMDIIQDAENYKDEVQANRQKNQQLVEKVNAMSQQLEQLSAENRVLRKMAGVPDDYQFELNDIIQEGQLQVEKYRAQVRVLEEEVEELEEERARLRRRLRENAIGGDAEDDTDEMASRKQLRLELNDLRAQVKKLEDENENLKMDGNMNAGRTIGGEGLSNDVIDEITKQNADLKEQLLEVIRTMQTGGNIQQSTLQQSTMGQGMQRNVGAFQSLAIPPTPLPGAFGNYNDVKDGYSQRFQSKLPVDMNNMLGDQGLDQMQVKFEIASLQLQNMETLKLLHEKEQEYLSLQNEVAEIKDDVKNKCLLIQDELFAQYHKEKQEWKQQYQELDEKYKSQQDLVAEQKVKLDQYQDYLNEVQRKDPNSLSYKFADLTKKSAILDVNLIKLSRKYDALSEEYNQIKMSFINISAENIEKEKDLLEKLYKLIHWKKNAEQQLKILLNQIQNSVPLEQHHIQRQRLEYAQDKLANLELKETEYLKKIAILESSERELYEKGERIRSLEEELTEVQLEEEVVKKRLENLDPYFRKFQLVYSQMVDFIKLKNISPLQMFQMFDENGDGHISRKEFQTAIKNMGIPIQDEEMEVLYMFIDLDGTGEIEYHEFIRRLRRSGVNVRKKEDELLFTLYRAIQDAGLSLRSAFEAFDTNGDNIISKDDMKVILDEMNIKYQPEAIDYIFKLADTSGDNQISYDEFQSLFQGIVKNQMQEENRQVGGELDWKMQVMIKLDAAVKEQSLTLLDAFKIIDRNEDETISLREFSVMFEQMEINLASDAVKDIFHCMDKDRNGEITYNEMLNYLRQCKREEEKLRKLKFIQERTNILREQMAQENNLQEQGQNTVMTMESRLQMKIAILEMREKNANDKSKILDQQLKHQEQIIKDLNKHLNELQQQLEKSNETFYREREENMHLKDRVQGAISKEESEKLKRMNENYKLQVVDLNSALTTYRSLYDTAVTQTKIMRVTVEKIRNDQDSLQQTIKELQSQSDQNAVIGRLYHHVMISRWNEGQTNQKYEKLLDELRRLKLEESSFEAIMKDRSEEIQEQTTLFRETILNYEKQITDLQSKLLPTVTLQRVEEQNNKMKEVSDLKFEVEKQNRALREQFYELQLKADYFDIYKSKLDELEDRLKKSNTDELSQQIIEVSEKLSETKMEFLKSQRDLAMAREKEDYYQRLNRQYTDRIKQLEFDLSNSDLNLRKREEMWRRKFYEQRKTIFTQFGLKEEENTTLQTLEEKSKQTQAKMTEYLQSKQGPVVPRGKITIDESEYMELKAQIEELESKVKNRDTEIESLLERNKVAGTGLPGMSQMSLEAYTKDVLTQEAEKVAMAAQQTIRTLQDIIRDKDAQIERRNVQMESIKTEAMAHKKKDLEEISRLNDLLYQRNKDQMNMQHTQLGMQPQMQQDEFTPVLLQQYQEKLQGKDSKIKELEINLQAEKKALKKMKEEVVRLMNDKDQLQADLITEQKKNEAEKYRKQVETLQKVVNSKNKELQNIKNTLTQLKEELFKISQETSNKEQDFKTKEDKLSLNNTELETKMRQMLNEIKKLKKEIKDKHDELDMIRMKEIEQRAKMTDLEKQNQELKATIAASGGKVDDPNSSVINLQQKLQQANQLQIENATLQKEVQFLKAQGAAKSLFDKEGNLQCQSGQMYFKSYNELCQVIQQYLQTKPRIKILNEFEKFDQQKTRVLPLAKIFEILGTMGIKFKTRDQKLLIDNIRVEKSDLGNYFTKLYYEMKNCEDKETITDEDQSMQQSSSSMKQTQQSTQQKFSLKAKK